MYPIIISHVLQGYQLPTPIVQAAEVRNYECDKFSTICIHMHASIE